MGTSLTNCNVQDTYQGLIKTNGCNETLNATPNILTDGNGNDSSLAISTASNGIQVTGNSIVDGILTTCSNIRVNGNNICDSVASRITLGDDTTINSCLKLGSNIIKDSTGVDRITFTTASDLVSLNCNVTVTGNLSAGGDLVAFYTSDKNLKDNLQKIESESFFDNLTGYTFDWNENSIRDGKGYGFIAQDLEKIAPELVKVNSDDFKSINYVELIPVLFEEIKSLKSRIEKLENSK